MCYVPDGNLKTVHREANLKCKQLDTTGRSTWYGENRSKHILHSTVIVRLQFKL